MLPRRDDDSSMKFIETMRYQKFPIVGGPSRSLPIPHPWKQYEHPNSDVYYYNPELRLITAEDIRHPEMLQYVMDAREDHLRCLDDKFSSMRQLPGDWELTLSDVTDQVAVIGMFSRSRGAAYEWTEEKGLQAHSSPEYFWSHVAEYPSHHPALPPNAELEFTRSLSKAKIALSQGALFPFSEAQIDQIIERYQNLKALEAQGERITPRLGWLIGAVMPLDAVGRSCNEEDLGRLMLRMRL